MHIVGSAQSEGRSMEGRIIERLAGLSRGSTLSPSLDSPILSRSRSPVKPSMKTTQSEGRRIQDCLGSVNTQLAAAYSATSEERRDAVNVSAMGHDFHRKKNLAVFIVTLTLFLDLCLMTALVPIAPAYLGLNANDTNIYSRLGILFSSNAGLQLLTNIFLGPAIDRYGSTGPLFSGVMAMTVSTLVFAFAGDISWVHRYPIVLAARTLQGISSACAATGGMAWLATLFPTDEERGEAMGTAMSGLGLGVLVGPPMGAAFTNFGIEAGWKYPFLILAFLCVVDASLQVFLVWSPLPTFVGSEEPSTVKPLTAVKQLATDPYIIISFCLSFFGNGVMSVLEASLPQVLEHQLHASGWVLGAIFIPCTMPYILAAPLSGKYLSRLGRHWGLLIGGLCLVVGIAALPFVAEQLKARSLSIWYLSVPLSFCGAGIGIMDSSVMLYIAEIVQKRHSSLFGSSCAIVDASVSMAFFIAPLCSSYLIDAIDYKWVYIGLGGLLLLWMPGVYVLHGLTKKDYKTDTETEPGEQDPLISSSSLN